MQSCKKTVLRDLVQSASIDEFTFGPINLWSIGPKRKKQMIKLYTTPTCVNCPAVKKKLDAAGIEYISVDASLSEGREELFAQGVRGVPYLHAVNAYGSEYKALGNAITIKSLMEFLGV